jgi:hypothetical protein
VTLDEVERLVGDLTPAVVDDEAVSASGELGELGGARVLLLFLDPV